MEAVIRERILDFHQQGVPPYVHRDQDVPFLPNMVTTIIGARKVGKTFRAYQAVDDLLKAGELPSIQQICYLHFDDEALSAMSRNDLPLIDRTFLSLQTPEAAAGPLLFVFDEIHRIDGWDQFVLRLARNPLWRVLVTGSSSELEEDKVGRQLRGKTFSRRLHPLSFAEFLRFRHQELTPGRHSSADVAVAIRLFQDYLRVGSYPALACLEDELQRELLQSYFTSIVAGDLIFAHDISSAVACKTYLRDLFQRNACPYRHRRELNNLGSMGHRLAPATISDWFCWTESSYVVEGCPIHTESRKRIEQNYRKLYAVDWALANAVSPWSDERLPQSLECLVYWHLRRAGYEVTYDLLGPDKFEIDCLAARPGSPPELAVQVCYRLSATSTIERETRGFERLRKRYPDIDCMIVTAVEPPSDFMTEVPIITAWKWCLATSKRVGNRGGQAGSVAK